ncbi:hypothetical protein CBR_g2828 [Chara braunii]|uniref:Uncharacterized protein n=1 Tax=Chara braunii TaxID=69332 RepID=A0A388KDZ5_CHABU|nr:hypothetical protein CBR_g2828 [Chara braunii]|eukprot:GBG68280.1 hypothetical protein CBR_g2828 [Chara braunii]
MDRSWDNPGTVRQTAPDNETWEGESNSSEDDSSIGDYDGTDMPIPAHDIDLEDEEFPREDLLIVLEGLNKWPWTVYPTQLRNCLAAAAKIVHGGGEDVSPELRRLQTLYREAVPNAFEKCLDDKAIWKWNDVIHSNIFDALLRLIDVVVVKLPQLFVADVGTEDDVLPLLRSLSLGLDKSSQYHIKHKEQVLPDVATQLSDPERFARPIAGSPARTKNGDWYCTLRKAHVRTTDGCSCHRCRPPPNFCWLAYLLNYLGLGQYGNGYEVLLKVLQGLQRWQPAIMEALLQPIAKAAEFLVDDCAAMFLDPCRSVLRSVSDLLERDVDALSDKTRDGSYTALSQILKYLQAIIGRSLSAEKADGMVAQVQRRMVERMLGFPSFNKQLSAVREINKLLENARSIAVRDNSQAVRTTIEWLEKNDILRRVLRSHLHHKQYVDQVEKIMRFLLQERCLSEEHLNAIWAATEKPDQFEAVKNNIFDLLADLAWSFSPEQLDSLFGRFERSQGRPASDIVKILQLVKKLARSDTKGVMATRLLELLWNMMHSGEVPAEVLESGAMTEILGHYHSVNCASKDVYIQRCLAMVRKGESVIPSLRLLREIILLDPERPFYQNHVAREKRLQALNAEHELLQLVVASLESWMSHARTLPVEVLTGVNMPSAPGPGSGTSPRSLLVDGRYMHEERVKEQLEFLLFALKAGSLRLPWDTTERLWNCLVEDPACEADRQKGLEWFSNAMNKAALLTVDAQFNILTKKLTNMDPATLTGTAFRYCMLARLQSRVSKYRPLLLPIVEVPFLLPPLKSRLPSSPAAIAASRTKKELATTNLEANEVGHQPPGSLRSQAVRKHFTEAGIICKAEKGNEKRVCNFCDKPVAGTASRARDHSTSRCDEEGLRGIIPKEECLRREKGRLAARSKMGAIVAERETEESLEEENAPWTLVEGVVDSLGSAVGLRHTTTLILRGQCRLHYGTRANTLLDRCLDMAECITFNMMKSEYWDKLLHELMNASKDFRPLTEATHQRDGLLKGSIFWRSVYVTVEQGHLSILRHFEEGNRGDRCGGSGGVIMDNVAVCPAAGQMIEADHPHIFSVPCTAHSLDLMFESFTKIGWVGAIANRASEVAKFFTNDSRVWKLPVHYSNGGVVSEPARDRAHLRQLFVKATHSILDDTFWADVQKVMQTSKHVLKLLKKVDGTGPTISGDHMDSTVEKLTESKHFAEAEELLEETIMWHWNTMTSALHCAALFLDPEHRGRKWMQLLRMGFGFGVTRGAKSLRMLRLTQRFVLGSRALGDNCEDARAQTRVMQPARCWRKWCSDMPIRLDERPPLVARGTGACLNEFIAVSVTTSADMDSMKWEADEPVEDLTWDEMAVDAQLRLVQWCVGLHRTEPVCDPGDEEVEDVEGGNLAAGPAPARVTRKRGRSPKESVEEEEAAPKGTSSDESGVSGDESGGGCHENGGSGDGRDRRGGSGGTDGGGKEDESEGDEKGGSSCFTRLFQWVNLNERKLKRRNHDDNSITHDLDLIGLSYVWKIILHSPVNDIVDLSINMLRDIHTCLADALLENVVGIRQHFIGEVLERLEAAIETGGIQNPARMTAVEQSSDSMSAASCSVVDDNNWEDKAKKDTGSEEKVVDRHTTKDLASPTSGGGKCEASQPSVEQWDQVERCLRLLQLDTLKTEVQQLQLPNKEGNNLMHYKMPTFHIEKFDDYMHQDPVLWWEGFTTQLRILFVAKHAYIGALFLSSKGGCQIWLTHLASTHGVDVADLKDKISWEELTWLWKKRFIVDDAPALAINRLFNMTQGNTATRDWLMEWQNIAATPDLDLPFTHLRREFYNRSCAALSLALGDREQYATFAEIIDKAREIIKTNRAAHERSTWQPTYVEKLKTGPRPQHVAAVQSDSGEDQAASQASREGDQVAAVQPRSNNKSRGNGKAKSASQAGNGQPTPSVKFNLTEAEYKYRGRYDHCYRCNSTKHKTSLCQDQAKEDATPPPTLPDSAAWLAASYTSGEDVNVVSSRYAYEDNAVHLVPPLDQRLHVQQSTASTVSSPSATESAASPQSITRDSTSWSRLEELDPLTFTDFQWMPVPPTGRLPKPHCNVLMAQLRDYLHIVVPTPLMDAGVEVVDLHAYIAKIDREFKTQRYDDIDAPLLYVRIQIGEATCSALIDCGASRNYIN